jgi:O-antigen/teichoic acid export membrane protein
MSNLHRRMPVWAWQILLMGLLGLSGIFFVPLLLRWANSQLMATVLVAQVHVYYLVVLVQFGFALSGPARVAKATNVAGAEQIWRNSVQVKLLILACPVALLFGGGYVGMAWGQWYLWVFALLLGAYALNSNWWLQAKQDFTCGTGFAAFGVLLSVCLLYLMTSYHERIDDEALGAMAVLVLVLPQICVGFGTWYATHKACEELPVDGITFSAGLDLVRNDLPLVASQLLLLASTTLGTVVVGAMADANTTTAYAAIEKLFNLGATMLVGLYMAIHPRFAAWFHQDRGMYWKRAQYLLGACAVGGMCLALLLNWVGDVLLNLYLPAHLAAHVLSVMVPFALWLGLCMGQHVLTGYLVFAERNDLVLWVNAGVLFATLLVGYFCARLSPVTWVYGMLIGQILVMLLLLKLRHDDKAVCL